MKMSEVGRGVRNRHSHQQVPGARNPNHSDRAVEGGGVGRNQDRAPLAVGGPLQQNRGEH